MTYKKCYLIIVLSTGKIGDHVVIQGTVTELTDAKIPSIDVTRCIPLKSPWKPLKVTSISRNRFDAYVHVFQLLDTTLSVIVLSTRFYFTGWR